MLTDIEGTTSSIDFVKDVLFPYARARLPAFVRANAHEPAVREQLDATARETDADPGDVDALIDTLVAWIDEDRKATPLKALQGMIWASGYRDRDYVAHVYDDAAAALRHWKDAGHDLYVYSSGSVPAQKLFFAHSTHGDLTPLFSGYFDTTTGPKRDAESYARIAAAIGVPVREVLFLSDIDAEIEAARKAGMRTRWVRRDLAANATLPNGAVRSFADISP
ncbi:MAG TPA: acireductone synthase [Xanthomonadales bacterium]|nr:acireductone synthase [Xanthomonadales bacterium]